MESIFNNFCDGVLGIQGVCLLIFSLFFKTGVNVTSWSELCTIKDTYDHYYLGRSQLVYFKAFLNHSHKSLQELYATSFCLREFRVRDSK